ncbi:hypothetical protein BC936DRAFT_137864 [Jimgerdemannia flammicorona]|uniref:Uncharacterized protein n=1 Tax=Jimgerdemannia flammicorona TaxID=994334 RepID=A0A433CWI8_9FUNG|nr:hypothetical protein BC936DRAFT_137864 [Jimgerdemannia flammicorona]
MLSIPSPSKQTPHEPPSSPVRLCPQTPSAGSPSANPLARISAHPSVYFQPKTAAGGLKDSERTVQPIVAANSAARIETSASTKQQVNLIFQSPSSSPTFSPPRSHSDVQQINLKFLSPSSSPQPSPSPSYNGVQQINLKFQSPSSFLSPSPSPGPRPGHDVTPTNHQYHTESAKLQSDIPERSQSPSASASKENLRKGFAGRIEKARMEAQAELAGKMKVGITFDNRRFDMTEEQLPENVFDDGLKVNQDGSSARGEWGGERAIPMEKSSSSRKERCEVAIRMELAVISERRVEVLQMQAQVGEGDRSIAKQIQPTQKKARKNIAAPKIARLAGDVTSTRTINSDDDPLLKVEEPAIVEKVITTKKSKVTSSRGINVDNDPSLQAKKPASVEKAITTSLWLGDGRDGPR